MCQMCKFLHLEVSHCVSHCCGIQAGSYNRLAEGVHIVPGVDIVSVTCMAIYYQSFIRS